MARLVAQAAGILTAIILLLLVISLHLSTNGQILTAFVYTDSGTRYFVLLDTRRNLPYWIHQPVEALRGVYFSPNGRRALIPYGETSQLMRLAIFDLTTQRLIRNIGEYDTCSPSYDALVWSPNSRYVLFDCKPTAAAPGSSGLHIMDYEAQRTWKVASGQFSGLSLWSPNGESLLINGSEILNLSSDIRQHLPPGAWLARWLPDSSHAILVIDDDILFDDGTIISADLSVAPTFFEVSPDGHYLAFVAQEKGLQRLYVVNLTTFERTLLDGGDLKIDAVQRGVWSPDAKWIAVEALNEWGSRDLYLIAPDTNRAYWVAEDAILPIWSPDSTHLAYLALNRSSITGDQLVVWDVASQTVKLTIDDAEQAAWSIDGLVHIRRVFGHSSYVPRQLYINERRILNRNIISFALWGHQHD
ncbi:MAG: hypothetical protein Kow00117_18400 [Phototrophicales bacterium]